MKFISKQQDRWHMAAGEDGPIQHPLPAPCQLLTLEQWRVVRDTWPPDLPIGVIVPNDVDIETIEEDLPRLQLVALHFPKWVDGRAYTQAHILRARFRYPGEVRATGEVLVDMLPLMKRTGFDAVVLRGDQKMEHAERALNFFPGHYQGDVREYRPLFSRPANEVATREFVQQGAAI
ncbi:MAG TPA: DUF934 domain-containing protein [Burkholderiaceae bacterium]|nr:DUF934 domain-containing protein [Burkholderiaceae bacterium]